MVEEDENWDWENSSDGTRDHALSSGWTNFSFQANGWT